MTLRLYEEEYAALMARRRGTTPQSPAETAPLTQGSLETADANYGVPTAGKAGTGEGVGHSVGTP